MKTVKKTPVKKYQSGGSKTSMLDKRIAKKTAKKEALDSQIKKDAPMGMGDAWTKLNPKSQRLNKSISRLTAKSQAKSGGSVAKMKRGGTTKRK
jgi:hypothetical protein